MEHRVCYEHPEVKGPGEGQGLLGNLVKMHGKGPVSYSPEAPAPDPGIVPGQAEMVQEDFGICP